VKIRERFSGKRIVVVGDVMVDRFLQGDVSRISPEAPVPVVAVREEHFVLGGAANVANNIAALGGEVFLAGVIGDDEAGRSCAALLSSSGIDGSGLLIQEGRPTTVKTRIIARGQQVLRVDWEDISPVSPSLEEGLLESLRSHIQRCDGVIVSDYAKGVITSSFFHALSRFVRDAGIPLFLDPKPSQTGCYSQVDLMTPNLPEASAMTGMSGESRDGLEEILRRLQERFGCHRGVVVTLGAEGMAYIGEDGVVKRVPTVAREVYDVTGAGDTAMAALALSLAAGLSLAQAVEVANAAAGVVVGKMGTALAYPGEVEEMLQELSCEAADSGDE